MTVFKLLFEKKQQKKKQSLPPAVHEAQTDEHSISAGPSTTITNGTTALVPQGLGENDASTSTLKRYAETGFCNSGKDIYMHTLPSSSSLVDTGASL